VSPENGPQAGGTPKPQKQFPGGEDITFLWYRAGILWGRTKESEKLTIYHRAQICADHPQKAELAAAALLITAPGQRNHEYKTPVGPAGSEGGKTQVSAVVTDTRLRPAGFRDTVQVTMLPNELAGPVMERAQAIFDKANKTQWLPWRHQDSGISFVKESGEPLSPTEIMPTDQSNETILLKGNKYGQRKAAELRDRNEGPRADKAKGRKSQGKKV
jgi:hypothetical protein